MSTFKSAARSIRERLRPIAVVAVSAAFLAPGVSTAHAAAPAAGSAHVPVSRHPVTYHGLTLDVPASWPVVNLDKAPGTCVRLDRSVVYLGHPGARQACPAHMVGGKADAVLVEPAADAVVENPAKVVQVPAGAAMPKRVAATEDHQVQLAVAGAGVLVTATYSHSPGAISAVIASGRVGPGAKPGTPVPHRATARSPRAAAAVPNTSFTGKGFDTCAAPASSVMNDWWNSSPYSAVGIYIGGPTRVCAQDNLSADWVSAQAAAGWHMMPVYAGLQAAGISSSSGRSQGHDSADDAVADAKALGFPAGSVVYLDMENYTSSVYSGRVIDYVAGWSAEMRALGYRAGVYAGGSSGVPDLASVYYNSDYAMPDVIWTANWDGNADVSDGPMDLPGGDYWSQHQRVHQYWNGYETYGGDRLGIDADYLDVGSAPVPTPPQRYRTASRVRGDFNGDGHDDVAALYGYADGSVALFTFRSNADGTFQAPVKSWSVGPGQWTYRSVKLVAGDFNGDGHADLAALYSYADGSVALFTFRSNADGTFQAPVKSWTVAPGQWYSDHMQLASGDFDGSGRDELAVFYGYSDGSAATFTFKTNADGTFQNPVRSWNVGAGQWWGNNVQLASGHFDGSGRDELAAFYGYSDGSAALFTFKSNPDGTFQAPVKSWNVGAGQWWGQNVQLTTGDFDGDKHTDIGAVYSYADGSVALFTFKANPDGTFQAPVKSWNVGPNQWYTTHAKFVGGNFDGSGRAGIAAFYGYSDGSAAMFTFKTNADGTFQAPVQSWNVGANQWWGDNVKIG